jgi:hypothetical protein
MSSGGAKIFAALLLATSAPLEMLIVDKAEKAPTGIQVGHASACPGSGELRSPRQAEAGPTLPEEPI